MKSLPQSDTIMLYHAADSYLHFVSCWLEDVGSNWAALISDKVWGMVFILWLGRALGSFGLVNARKLGEPPGQLTTS